MALNKPTLPEWAESADPTDIDVPAGIKEVSGWQQTEKPASEWMNWLQRQLSRAVRFAAKFLDIEMSKIVEGTIVYDSVANTVTFAGGIEISIFTDGTYYTNTIPVADSPITLADGEVLVFCPTDATQDLTAEAYVDLADGTYSVIAEASLTAQTTLQQIILLRRTGTRLDIPFFNQYLSDSGSLSMGGVVGHNHSSATEGGQLDWDNIWTDDPVHDHRDNPGGGKIDHGLALTGLGDDDHAQYILANGTRAFSGNQSMGTHKLTAVVDPTDAQDASTKYYVDNYIPTTVADHDHTGDAGDGGRLVIDDVVAAADKTGSGDVVLQVSPKIYTLETEGVSGSDDTIDMKWYNEDSDISGIKHTTILTTQASAALAIPPGTTHILNEKRISVNLAATGAADAWHSVFTSKLTSAAYDNLVIRVTAFGSTFNAHSSYLIGTSQWYSQRGVGGTTSVGTMASGGACGQRMTWDGTDEFTYDVNRDDTESSRYFLIIECWEV